VRSGTSPLGEATSATTDNACHQETTDVNGDTMQEQGHAADERPLQADLGWVIDQLTTAVPGIAHVLVATADGRTMAASPTLPAERAEQFASITCGLSSLAGSAAGAMNMGVAKQAVVEMASGYLIVMAISDGSCLAVLAARHVDQVPVDISVIGFQMGRLVTRLGGVLTPALRAALASNR